MCWWWYHTIRRKCLAIDSPFSKIIAALLQDMHEMEYDDMEVVIPFYDYIYDSTMDVPLHTSYR